MTALERNRADSFLVCHTGDTPPERVLSRAAEYHVEFVPLNASQGDLSRRLAELRPQGWLVNEPEWDGPYLSASLIEATGDLELVTYMGSSQQAEDYEDFFELSALRDRGAVVTTTSGAMVSVAEGTLALLSALNMGLVAVNGKRKSGLPFTVETRQSLLGSVLGIVGMGQIGRRVAQLAVAFGMRVVYFSRRRHIDVEDGLAASFLPLDDLFARSNHVSVHSSYSLTRGLIGRDQLRHGRDLNLINTADPPIVDPDALLEALNQGWVRRAAIEGQYPEIYDKHFRALSDDRVLMLPFMSWNTQHCRDRGWEAYLESLIAYRQGRRPVPYQIAGPAR